MLRYDRDNLPEGDWADYRKVGTTRMVQVSGPFVVTTKEGEYILPSGWYGYIAIDTAGHPYPIDPEVHVQSYERVDE